MPTQKMLFLSEIEEARLCLTVAEEGDAESLYTLGLMYGKGEVVKEDQAEAAHWIRLAAEKGHPTAQVNLGIRYCLGLGLDEDLVQAYAWASIAIVQDDESVNVFSSDLEIIASKLTEQDWHEARQLARTYLRKYVIPYAEEASVSAGTD